LRWVKFRQNIHQVHYSIGTGELKEDALVHMISDTLPSFLDFVGSALKTPVV
jgi:hypothetical protein